MEQNTGVDRLKSWGEQQAQRDSEPIKDVGGNISIKFQAGPIKEYGKNGIDIQDVLGLLTDRLYSFQSSPFRCRENAIAITKIEEAIMWLDYRTRRRTRQGIEGTNQEVAAGDITKGDQNAPVK